MYGYVGIPNALLRKKKTPAPRTLKEGKKITHADSVRHMSSEELAAFIDSVGGCPQGHEDCIESRDCEACWLDWLKQEAK